MVTTIPQRNGQSGRTDVPSTHHHRGTHCVTIKGSVTDRHMNGHRPSTPDRYGKVAPSPRLPNEAGRPRVHQEENTRPSVGHLSQRNAEVPHRGFHLSCFSEAEWIEFVRLQGREGQVSPKMTVQDYLERSQTQETTADSTFPPSQSSNTI